MSASWTRRAVAPCTQRGGRPLGPGGLPPPDHTDDDHNGDGDDYNDVESVAEDDDDVDDDGNGHGTGHANGNGHADGADHGDDDGADAGYDVYNVYGG